jgi:adenylosuccinate lyase
MCSALMANYVTPCEAPGGHRAIPSRARPPNSSAPHGPHSPSYRAPTSGVQYIRARATWDNRAVIDRYTLPEMGRIWSDTHKYEVWCEVECLVMEAHATSGTIPPDSVGPVRAATPPTPQQVAEVEAITQHDVIAFLTAWADNTEPRSAAAYVHHGMTSSDLLDTALAYQLVEATDVLLAKADDLVLELRDHALRHRDTVRVGRTHGIHAEPDTWGHRVADFAFAMARSRDRLHRARQSVGVMAISGAVGTYSNIDPAVEQYVARRLELRPADVSTQVVLRDGISEWVSALAIMATVCEAVALEVRHGQRTEVREVAESFGTGQRGSSAMPHKRNPILSERICGLARVVRAQVTPVMEGIPLWHERDISHSSVERIALPDAAITTDYLLHLTTRLITELEVDPEQMRANLDATGGLVYTSAALLVLVDAGLSRDEQAYPLVQAAAMETWRTRTPFRETLRRHAERAGVTLDEARLDESFRPERFLSRVDPVFERLERLV